jgi:hypothetical protein
MAQNLSIYLLPLIAAALVFLAKVYGHERAITRGSLSFALACISILLLVSYLVLSVFQTLPPYAGLGYGVVGIVLLILAVWMFRSY